MVRSETMKRKICVILMMPLIFIIDILIAVSGYRSFWVESLYSTWQLRRIWNNDHSNEDTSMKAYLDELGFKQKPTASGQK